MISENTDGTRKRNADDDDETKEFRRLWERLQAEQGATFRTAKNLPFTYQIRGNEIFVDRKAKSVTRASVRLAYDKAMQCGGRIAGPKSLGCFGASYLYAILLAFGILHGD